MRLRLKSERFTLEFERLERAFMPLELAFMRLKLAFMRLELSSVELELTSMAHRLALVVHRRALMPVGHAFPALKRESMEHERSSMALKLASMELDLTTMEHGLTTMEHRLAPPISRLAKSADGESIPNGVASFQVLEAEPMKNCFALLCVRVCAMLVFLSAAAARAGSIYVAPAPVGSNGSAIHDRGTVEYVAAYDGRPLGDFDDSHCTDITDFLFLLLMAMQLRRIDS